MKTGIELIAAERERQIKTENWTSEHDDTHKNGELAAAGACYALIEWSETDALRLWPWKQLSVFNVLLPDGFNPSVDRIRNLVKAGALIAAEIDRLQRLQCRASERVTINESGDDVMD